MYNLLKMINLCDERMMDDENGKPSTAIHVLQNATHGNFSITS